MTDHFARAVVIAAVTIVAAACAEPAGLRVAENSTVADVSPRALFGETRARTIDERFAAVAAASPGFAGVTMGANGEVVLHLTALADEPRTIAAFHTEFGRSTAGRPTRIERVRWSFTDLQAARERVEAAAEGLLVSSDIDEEHNRVKFVTRSAEALAQVRQLVESLGALSSAVSVSRGDAPRAMTSLSDGVRPVMGAMANDMQQTGQSCTLGVVTQYYGSSSDYVSTASHCTGTRYAVDSPMTLRQPTYWSADYPILGAVGGEAVDPGLFWGMTMCGGNRYCRYSDVALFSVSSTTAAGKLAQTTYSASTPGSLGSTTLAASP